ncbi:MAG: amidase [Gammaproteobacteria bacterium]|jgi:amidase
MPFELPDTTGLQRLARELGWDLDAPGAARLGACLAPFADGYTWLDTEPSGLPEPAYRQRTWAVPEPGENPHNAWFVRTSIETAALGPLRGKRLAVKDNIFVAGVPLSDGSALLGNFIADYDATVVTRLLDAGADIAGKSNCEYFCLSGGSTTSSHGTVENPRKPGYSTAGSSTGSAALVAAGEVDMALGTDQGGSVRSPASWTGICGMKATRGVVPYAGGMVMETSIDHIGPMTTNVADNAALLNVIAESRPQPFDAQLGEPLTGLRIGLLAEGFAHPLSDPQVDAAVRDAAGALAKLGAEVREVSVPAHPDGVAIWGAIVTDGYWQSLQLSGLGYNYEAPYSAALYDAMSSWQTHLPDMPVNAQVLMLLGKHLERYRGRYYGQAKNLALRLQAAYDQALTSVDVLLLPTTVQRAGPNPAADDLEGVFAQAFNNTINTAQFNATGHPALSIPCAEREDLPVGLMLVGRYFEEALLYQIAHAFEAAVDWQRA